MPSRNPPCHPEPSATGAQSKDLHLSLPLPEGTPRLQPWVSLETPTERGFSPWGMPSRNQPCHPERSAIGAQSKDLHLSLPLPEGTPRLQPWVSLETPTERGFSPWGMPSRNQPCHPEPSATGAQSEDPQLSAGDTAPRKSTRVNIPPFPRQPPPAHHKTPPPLNAGSNPPRNQRPIAARDQTQAAAATYTQTLTVKQDVPRGTLLINTTPTFPPRARYQSPHARLI